MWQKRMQVDEGSLRGDEEAQVYSCSPYNTKILALAVKWDSRGDEEAQVYSCAMHNIKILALAVTRAFHGGEEAQVYSCAMHNIKILALAVKHDSFLMPTTLNQHS